MAFSLWDIHLDPLALTGLTPSSNSKNPPNLTQYLQVLYTSLVIYNIYNTASGVAHQ